MNIQRIALIFDNHSRPETTGVYCRRALGALAEVEHFLPTELSRIPRQGFDLYLGIDDGLDYRLPSDLRPSAWWAIDTHLDFDGCLAKAQNFDVVFAAQRDGAEKLRRQGVTSASWLPLACDPEIHRRHPLSKEHDVCFVGNLFPGPRQELLQAITNRFPRTFVGRCYFEDMAKVYSASRVVFNRSIRNDVNMRVFEALACGSMLLTNDLRDNGQAELFQDGTHLTSYTCAEELLDKIAFYLKHEEARERIAAAGRTEVLRLHTYRHRMERLLAEVSCHLDREGPVLVRVPSNHPSAPLLPQEKKAESAGVLPQGRDPFYFEWDRPELLALVPPSARTVLDVGCGAGRLGQALKQRQPCRVLGIERDPEAAQAARTRLDQVFVGDVELLEPSIDAHSLDAVICGDILEHLRQPEKLLSRIRNWLHPAGLLVASIPNVRHHTVIRSLLGGNWTYEPAGLLDRDHLRFFTRREIEKLFFRTGFATPELRRKPGPGDEEYDQRPGADVRVGRLSISGLSPDDAAEFHTYQYLVSARPSPAADRGLTSIIIATCDQLEYTRLCVQSIFDRTDEPFELIFVDNGSTDGTVDYLRSLPNSRLVANADNLGFPKAVNQGLRLARGRQILLLNNDTVVTTGWLSRMLDGLHQDAKIGLVGPCSNSVSGEQEVPVSYEELGELDGFAWDWGKAHDRRYEQTDRLVGFCLLIRGELFQAIGELDERFGDGCYEDDDYCVRALQAGYRAVISRAAFVHHFGGRTFAGRKVDFAALMARNQQLFREKWQTGEQAARAGPLPAPTVVVEQPQNPPPAYHLRTARGGLGLELVRGKIELSLCMIVRNNADTIRPALESIRPWVDEMIVVDTGSTDDTPRIAAELGARVYHFPWCDDFSAARNESLRHARGQWLFWMDSDDTIDEHNGRMLREFVRNSGKNPDVGGYIVSVHCPGRPGEEDQTTVVQHVKLFRNHPQHRFDGRIHEQIIPAIRAQGGEIAWTGMFVVHSGYDHSAEGQKRKLDRDLRILHKELEERPEHPFTLFNLAMTYTDVGRYEEGINYARRSIARSESSASHVRKAYSFLVRGHQSLGQNDAAWQACLEGLRMFPLDDELRFRKATLLLERGFLNEAEQAFHHLLEVREEVHLGSVVDGIAGHLARHNLAAVYRAMNEPAKEEEQWRRILQEKPQHRAGWCFLGDCLLRQNKHDEAKALADRLLANGLASEGRMLQSTLAAARQDYQDARQQLEQGIADCPDDVDLWQALAHLLIERNDVSAAERALRELVRRAPTDASAHHNLGTIYLRLRRPNDAVEAFRQSLQFRPHAPHTHLNLGYALKEAGRLQEACTEWETVLRLEPSNQSAREALGQVR
jgi:GT2 family glycosyltransferase/predicted Zn-dependent protease/2-polyprenyl-3-methyl-5-hydroxy-6-metoxy-1,4-benzoquinol methylase